MPSSTWTLVAGRVNAASSSCNNTAHGTAQHNEWHSSAPWPASGQSHAGCTIQYPFALTAHHPHRAPQTYIQPNQYQHAFPLFHHHKHTDELTGIMHACNVPPPPPSPGTPPPPKRTSSVSSRLLSSSVILFWSSCRLWISPATGLPLRRSSRINDSSSRQSIPVAMAGGEEGERLGGAALAWRSGDLSSAGWAGMPAGGGLGALTAKLGALRVLRVIVQKCFFSLTLPLPTAHSPVYTHTQRAFPLLFGAACMYTYLCTTPPPQGTIAVHHIQRLYNTCVHYYSMPYDLPTHPR